MAYCGVLRHDILHHSARALPFILCASSAMVAPEVSSACAARMACRMWLHARSLSFVTAPCLLQAGRELRPKVVWTRRVTPGHFQKHPNSKRALKRHTKTAGRKEDERLWYEERMGTEPWEFIQLLVIMKFWRSRAHYKCMLNLEQQRNSQANNTRATRSWQHGQQLSWCTFSGVCYPWDDKNSDLRMANAAK